MHAYTWLVVLVLGTLCAVAQCEGLGYSQLVQDGFGFGTDEQFIAFRGGENPIHDTNYILVWHGCVFGADGYCEEGRAMIKALYSYGVNFVVSSIDKLHEAQTLSESENAFFKHLIVDPEKLRKSNPFTTIIAINHGPPSNMKKLKWADITVLRTMWEVSPFPAQFLSQFDQSEVWVPSEYNKKLLKEAGYSKENIYTVGECADEHYENFTSLHAMRIPGSKAFNFLSVFHWNYRKGWDVLVQAFLEEFEQREDVALVLKIYSTSPFEDNQRQLKRFIREKFPTEKDIPDRIVLINEALTTEQMPLLYKAANAFVLATRGEGWGRTTMEAMLLETPVIVTRCSGHEEFVTTKTAYTIPHKYVNVPQNRVDSDFPSFANSKWAEPDVATLRKHMRKVYKNPKEAAKKAAFAKTWYLEKFSRYQIAKRMKDRIDEIVSNYKKP